MFSGRQMRTKPAGLLESCYRKMMMGLHFDSYQAILANTGSAKILLMHERS
jgi:hypothetical protein